MHRAAAAGLFLALLLGSLDGASVAQGRASDTGDRPQVVRWQPLGPEGGRVSALVAQPTKVDTFYAGLLGGGVFVSRDGGRSWNELGRGLPALDIFGLAIDASEPEKVYAASFAGGVFGFEKGRWTELGTGLDGYWIKTLLAREGTLWVGTSQGVVFRLEPGAVAWEPSLAGPGRPVFALVANPDDGRRLLAGTADGIFSSHDGGVVWRPSDSGLGDPFVKTVVFDPFRPTRVYAGTRTGLWVSDDSGRSWRATGRGLPAAELRTLAFEAPGRLVGAGALGAFISRDQGRSWSDLGDGLPEEVNALAVAPNGRLLAGCAGAGILAREADAPTWLPSQRGLEASAALTLALDAREPERIWVGTAGQGVVTLLDDGSAEPAATLPGGEVVGSLVVLETTSPGGGSRPMVFAASAGTGLMRKDRYDGPWESVGAFPLVPVLGLAGVSSSGNKPATVWAALAGGGVLRSEDLGETWEKADQGLADTKIRDLAVSPRDRRSLWAVGDGGIFRSSDSGAHWQGIDLPSKLAVGLGAHTLEVLSQGPGRPPRVVAGTFTHGLLESLDGGETWAVDAKYPDREVRALAADPSPPGILFAASSGGVFERRGDGPWRQVAPGLASPEVVDLLFDPRPSGRLWAATLGRGVFVLTPEILPVGESPLLP